MTTENTTTTEPEQAADLAALQAAASAEDGSAAPVSTTDQVQEPKQPSAAAIQMATMTVKMVRPIAIFAFPALRGAPDELWEPIPEGVACVMDHYGMNPEWLKSPWARMAFSMAPLAAFSAVEIMKEKPPEPKPEALTGPGPDLTAPVPGAPVAQKTVTFGGAA